MAKLILFDMDDVLCTYSRDDRCAALAAITGRTTAEVHAAIWDSGLEQRSDEGAVTSAQYLQAHADRLGHPVTLDDWLRARTAGMTPRPAVLDMVRRVRARARVAVLTNNTALVGTHIARLFPELPPLFGDAIFTSAGLQAAKPGAEAFHRCLDALGAAPGDTLFTDDLVENIEGARRAGLAAHLYVSAAGLEAALAGFGVLTDGAAPPVPG